jgi:ribosomal protein L40E
MEHRLEAIVMKPSDYKICDKCGIINWYENEACWHCGSTEFNDDRDEVFKYMDDEYKYWIEEEGCSEEEADMVCVTVG